MRYPAACAANQLVNDGTNSLTYDTNGNMTSDGVNSYVWDRANRLLSMGGVSYQYNGDGNRIQQDALRYILDLQPGLAQVIGDSDGNRYIHSPRGVHAVNDGSMWQYPLTDALGSVRGYTDAHSNVLSNVNYSPIGVPDMNITGPAFTGEWRTGGTGMQYHRARYLSPGLGVWLSLDPFEGISSRPMSLNGYSWVEGNPIMNTDPSGKDIDRGDVENGRFYYSCNCGWIDLAHANPVNALVILSAVSISMNEGLYTSPSSTGIAFRYASFTGSTSFVGPVRPVTPPWYFLPRNASADRNFVALAIYLDLLSFIEQGERDSIFPNISASGQSVEDLPSYYMGFYMARQLEERGSDYVDRALTGREGSESFEYLAAMMSVLLQPCEILTQSQSLRVFDLETDENRPKNPSYLPVDRVNHTEVDQMCPNSPRDASRIPDEVFGAIRLTEDIVKEFGRQHRRSEGNDGCSRMDVPVQAVARLEING